MLWILTLRQSIILHFSVINSFISVGNLSVKLTKSPEKIFDTIKITTQGTVFHVFSEIWNFSKSLVSGWVDSALVFFLKSGFCVWSIDTLFLSTCFDFLQPLFHDHVKWQEINTLIQPEPLSHGTCFQIRFCRDDLEQSSQCQFCMFFRACELASFGREPLIVNTELSLLRLF